MQIIKINDWEEIPSNYTGIVEYPNGTKEWYLNGKWHREDGPAIEYANGTKLWYKNGKRHREDGPALESPDLYGYKAWFLNGKEYYPKSDDTIRNINQLLDTIEAEPNIDVKTVKDVQNSLLVFDSKVIISSGGYGFDLTIDSEENIYVDGEQIISPPLTEDTIDELTSIIMKHGQETTHKRFEKQAEDPFMKESFSLAKILFDN